jgi:cyanophycinase
MKKTIVFLALGLSWVGQTFAAKHYSYFRVGNASALLIDASGDGTVVGISTVYFLQAPGAPQVCQSKTPLTYQNIGGYRILAGGTFSLPSWTGQGGVSYSVSANAGVPASTQSGGSIY